MIPVECVARGYLVGSGWSEYQASGTVCGIRLPEGLRKAERLSTPLFTPTTKATTGHDEAISEEQMADLVGAELTARLKELTIAIYRLAAEHAARRGILLADTKLELGTDADGQLSLADEVLTPDSSRFWPAETWRPGQPQPSYDKQYVRNWLISPVSGWDRRSGVPPPSLPDEVVAATRVRYVQAYERLTRQRIADWIR
jgi:phosphoribosylaminoimidazole-succinocarboxamide synthase